MDALIIPDEAYFKGFKYTIGSTKRTNSFVSYFIDNRWNIEILKDKPSKSFKSYDLILCRYLDNYYKYKLWRFRNVLLDIDDNPIIQAKINKTNLVLTSIKYLVAKLLAKYYVYSYNIKGHYLPNIVTRRSSTAITNNKILFIGSKYSPNALGITKFYKEVYEPYLLNDYELHVVGDFYTPIDNEHPKWIRHTNINDDSLDELYRECSIVVVPIFKSAGTCIKVLEALSYDKYTIVTPEVDRNLGLCNFYHVARTPKAFVDFIANHHLYPVTNSGSKFTQKYHSQKRFDKLLDEIIESEYKWSKSFL